MKARLPYNLAALATGVSLLAGAAAAQSIYIEQVGTDNGRGILGGRIHQTSEAARMSITQAGEDNDFSIDQSGLGAHEANIVQAGSDNLASITQSEDAPNVATILQGGLANSASITQASLTNGHAAFISQNGSGNGAYVNQSGGGHNATIAQKGDGNSASLSQTGDDNSATFSQDGDGNSMSGAQSGSGNTLALTQIGNGLSTPTVTQTGGSSIAVTQTMIDPIFVLPK